MKAGWRRQGARPELYGLGFATSAVTGFGLAAANDWWWPGLLIMAVALVALAVVLYDLRRGSS
jgi:hypothetical protein